MGIVILATGAVEFDDGLWIRNQLKAWNGRQRILDIPGVLPGAVCIPRFLRVQTEFLSIMLSTLAEKREGGGYQMKDY